MVDQRKEGADLESIYHARFGRFVGLAEWLVGDRRVAEELVQETFARLVESPPRLQNPDALESFVRAALVNRCRSKIRRLIIERRHSPLLADNGTTDHHKDTDLRRAVAALPERQRQCTALRFYEDMTVQQIAATLRISEGSVKTHLHRALRTLEEALSEGPQS